MEFKKYQSIENSYKKKTIEIIEREFPNEEFIVEEKIHGANFSIWTDGNVIKGAKRSGFLKPDEVFYNSDKIIESYKESVIMAFKDLQAKSVEKIESLAFFGEIFGGSYNHEDIDKDSASRKVQRGVEYSPHNEFMIFDVFVNGKLVSIEDCDYLSGSFGFMQAPMLFKGTLQDCLKYSNKFQSKVSELLELPPIENNFCEGVVIKPVNPLFLKNGNRVILKNKNEGFSEIGAKKEIKVKEDDSINLTAMKGEVSAYVTKNRLRCVLSNIGQESLESSDFNLILKAFIKDIHKDLNLSVNLPEKIKVLSKIEDKEWKKYLTMLSSSMIRVNLREIINNEF